MQSKAFSALRETLAVAGIVRQHPNVAGSKLARISVATLALLGAAVGVTGACDATVTPVGSWEPIMLQPPAGQAGMGGVSGMSGSAGGGAGGMSGGAGAGAGGAAAGEGGEAGQPEPTGPGLYLEAENGELSGGFTIGADGTASNGAYIQGPPGVTSDTVAGAAQARYTFELPKDGTYVIWGRIYSPDTSSNRFWFQLDGGKWYLWRITVGTIWFWNYFHEDVMYNDILHFPLTAGAHTLVIANSVPDARLD
ncbi:MAG TPA: hypothetical protein VNG33_13510, partial [Polyangiaceae bacterium]|nr:hypothetical protein [Polyangiaceae bacterium]